MEQEHDHVQNKGENAKTKNSQNWKSRTYKTWYIGDQMKICSKILNCLEKVMKTNRGLAKNTSKKPKFRFLFNLNMFFKSYCKTKGDNIFLFTKWMEICLKHHAHLLKAPQNNIIQQVNPLKNEALLSQPSFKVVRSCENWSSCEMIEKQYIFEVEENAFNIFLFKPMLCK